HGHGPLVDGGAPRLERQDAELGRLGQVRGGATQPAIASTRRPARDICGSPARIWRASYKTICCRFARCLTAAGEEPS
ncbi:MAG: hypothetical protein ACXWES_01510, partial [Solirubrobacterales bacterium]